MIYLRKQVQFSPEDNTRSFQGTLLKNNDSCVSTNEFV